MSVKNMLNLTKNLQNFAVNFENLKILFMRAYGAKSASYTNFG